MALLFLSPVVRTGVSVNTMSTPNIHPDQLYRTPHVSLSELCS